MGLDAVVYRSKKSLPFEPDTVGAILDVPTGEYYVPDRALEPAFEQNSHESRGSLPINESGISLLSVG